VTNTSSTGASDYNASNSHKRAVTVLEKQAIKENTTNKQQKQYHNSSNSGTASGSIHKRAKS
jgi:hypothetical protein